MFGHLQRAITSGSHKLVPLDESLDSIRSDTGFAFAHFAPWRHYTRSKIKVGRHESVHQSQLRELVKLYTKMSLLSSLSVCN